MRRRVLGQGALYTAPFAVLALALTLPGLEVSAAERAGQPQADHQAELWAAGCATCHSTSGVGSFPALYGRDAGELLELLLRHRAGTADTTIMHQHAKGFSEAELARIAAVFAAKRRP